MVDYVKTTNFLAKDSLVSGDPNKRIRGAEFNVEFDNLATAVASKVEKNNGVHTGTTSFQNVTMSGTLSVSGVSTLDSSNVTNNAVITGALSAGAATLITTGNRIAVFGASSIFSANPASTGTLDNVTIGATVPAAATATNLAYTGTLTGGTGVINIGSGQFYKTSGGLIGFGTVVPVSNVDVRVGANSGSVAVGRTDRDGVFFVAGTTNAFLQGTAVGDIGLQARNSNNLRIGTDSATYVAVNTNNAERLRIDSAGNMGLAVTPNANWTDAAFQVGFSGSLHANKASNFVTLGLNAYNVNANNFYLQNGFAGEYSIQSTGNHVWRTAPTGTAGGAITFTQAMTLTQGGNLLLGTAVDSGYRAQVITPSAVGATRLAFELSDRTSVSLNFSLQENVANIIAGSADTLVLGADNAERARITSGGFFKVSNTGSYGNVAGLGNASNTLTHVFQSDQNSTTLDTFNGNTGSNVRNFSSALASGAVGQHFRGVLNNVVVYQVNANGNVQNTNNSYGAISDAKLKENVVDASSYLDKFMQVRFRNYNLIGSDMKQFGVIAQELEQVFPGLVDSTPDVDEEGNDLGTVTKSVKYSVLAQMQGKVIQEQQLIIEQQQAVLSDLLQRVAALEAK